jgi:predicted lipoprotein with Yx(FWY)xxD motif
MVAGGHLVDANGRTLYLWVADPAGKSVCTGACASVWPPAPASGTPTARTGVDAAKLTTIARSDGGSQLAYAGHPLYYFAADTSAGQTAGQGSDGFGAKWWEVGPAGQAITSTSAPSGPATTSGGNGY